jgi:hypothetical protein
MLFCFFEVAPTTRTTGRGSPQFQSRPPQGGFRNPTSQHQAPNGRLQRPGVEGSSDFRSQLSSDPVETDETRKRRVVRHERDRTRRGFVAPQDASTADRSTAASRGPRIAPRRAKTVRAPKIKVEIPSLVSVDVLAKLLGVRIGKSGIVRCH